METFLFNGLGLSLESETRIDQWQAFDIFNNMQAFSKRGRKQNFAAFCTNRFEAHQGMSVELSRKTSKISPAHVHH